MYLDNKRSAKETICILMLCVLLLSGCRYQSQLTETVLEDNNLESTLPTEEIEQQPETTISISESETMAWLDDESSEETQVITEDNKESLPPNETGETEIPDSNVEEEITLPIEEKNQITTNESEIEETSSDNLTEEDEI